MRFLADESCDEGVVKALRQASHDVKAVRDWHRGAPDAAVIELARTEERILLTEDKDFGRLFFASVTTPAGVALIRYPAKVSTSGPTVSNETLWLRYCTAARPTRGQLTGGSIG